MNKNNKEPKYQKKWFFLDNVYLFLLIIGGIALIVRLAFLHTEIPLNSDNFIYFRDNPRGKHSELWHHVAGCRQWFKVLRDTSSHEIFKTAKLTEEL